MFYAFFGGGEEFYTTKKTLFFLFDQNFKSCRSLGNINVVPLDSRIQAYEFKLEWLKFK